MPRITRALADLDVAHVVDLGWSGRRNGVLLASMLEAVIFITVDGDRRFGGTFRRRASVFIVLHAAEHVQGFVAVEVRTILATAEPGKVYRAGV
ncbi:MAG: hypothetical protein U5K74_14800 [Gemmatimonadaceae bacterium]|nr:hypothetical protein [Gemmatimonadaceae bacterium]